MTAPAAPAASSRSVLRTVAGPLVLYHALVLAGAYFVIVGTFDGSLRWQAIGIVLIVAGIAIQSAILVWAARLARRAPVGDGRAALAEVPSTAPPVPRRWLCVRCGWSGPGPRAFCPRCGGPPPVRTSGAWIEARPASPDR